MNNENNQSNYQNVNNNVNPNIAPNGTASNPTSVSPFVQNGVSQSTPVAPVIQNSIPQPTVTTPMQNATLQNVQNQVPTNSGAVPAPNNQPSSDYVPPSKGKVFFMFFFFALLIGFVVFLPNITEMIHKYQSGENQKPVEKIVDGKLTCTLEKSNDNFDFNYTAIFTYSNNKLERLSLTTITKGDISKDANQLDELANKCSLLEKSVEDIDEVTIRCNYTDGELEEKQSFSLGTLDYKKLDSAFSEAGGTVPNYQYGESIDSIEKEMNASGYTCNRSAE